MFPSPQQAHSQPSETPSQQARTLHPEPHLVGMSETQSHGQPGTPERGAGHRARNHTAAGARGEHPALGGPRYPAETHPAPIPRGCRQRVPGTVSTQLCFPNRPTKVIDLMLLVFALCKEKLFSAKVVGCQQLT